MLSPVGKLLPLAALPAAANTTGPMSLLGAVQFTVKVASLPPNFATRCTAKSIVERVQGENMPASLMTATSPLAGARVPACVQPSGGLVLN